MIKVNKLIFLLFAGLAIAAVPAGRLKGIGRSAEGIVKEVSSTKKILHPGIDQYIKSMVDTANFQGVVLVVKGDKLIHKSVYGYSNRATKQPIQITTQYLLGSLTKSFVSVAVMQLVETGKLTLLAPVSTYLPELNASLAKGLTIHHLLKHQSGLSLNLDAVTKYQLAELTPGELLDLINQTKRRHEAGNVFEVSALNFMLLGMIIERVSKQSYESYMQDHLFRPLRLKHTGIANLFVLPKNKANGYRLINGTIRRIEDIVSYGFATADMYSSVDDLFTWGYALQHGLLVGSESRQLLFNGGVKEEGNYGYGFRTQAYLGSDSTETPVKLIRHGGVMNGFCANYHYYDKDDMTIIILNNYRNLKLLDITFKIKELVYGYKPGQRKNKYHE